MLWAVVGETALLVGSGLLVLWPAPPAFVAAGASFDFFRLPRTVLFVTALSLHSTPPHHPPASWRGGSAGSVFWLDGQQGGRVAEAMSVASGRSTGTSPAISTKTLALHPTAQLSTANHQRHCSATICWIPVSTAAQTPAMSSPASHRPAARRAGRASGPCVVVNLRFPPLCIIHSCMCSIAAASPLPLFSPQKKNK